MRSLIALLLLTASCPPLPSPSPSSTPIPTPFPTASPTPLPIPTCAPCPPCESPIPTPSPSESPSPTPSSYPDHCPKMVCWKPQQTLFGPSDLKVGNSIVIDSTEFFSVCLPRGRCNAEVNIVCGGRPCEDPRGVKWYQKSGPSIPSQHWKVQANESGDGSNEYGYQLKIKIPAKGSYTICVSILPDLRDALGKSVSFAQDAGRCTTFEVTQ